MPSSLVRMLRDDWRKNYRYHGGLKALWRSCRGDWQLRRGTALPEPSDKPRLDCVVFSVVPELSALWALMFQRVVGRRPMRLLLGDCSGGLVATAGGPDACSVVPMLNHHHGEKLDLAFKHLCRADVILATDDDIFWLDDEPLNWALDRLAADPEIAVVALAPKRGIPEVLVGKVEKAMGSILVIRRDLWLREGLSFKVAYPKPHERLTWLYDTGEFAQVELGRRGYRVEFGPEELRWQLVELSGISSWTLKMQKHEGRIRPAVSGFRGRQRKALQTILVLRALERIYSRASEGRRQTHLLSPVILNRAESICLELLAPEIADSTRKWVNKAMSLIEKKLFDLGDSKDLGKMLDRMLLT